jgi:hypothetical protein
MAQYPTFHLSGVPLDDPEGRWNLVPGTQVLSAFPGLRESTYSLPGMWGEQSVAHAPGQPTTRRLRLQFHARRASGSIAPSTAERMKLLAEHISEFYRATRLAAAAYMGDVELRHFLSASDQRLAYGRVISTSEPQYEPYGDYATLEMIFSIPQGRWFSTTAIETNLPIPGSTEQTFTIPAGDAPVDNMLIQVRGPLSISTGNPLRVMNEAGHGFEFTDPIPAGQYLIVNPLMWGSRVYASTAYNWTISPAATGALRPVGKPHGSALALFPGSSPNTAVIRIKSPGAGEARIRARKAWF